MDGLTYKVDNQKSQQELLEMFNKMKNSSLTNPDFNKVPLTFFENEEKKTIEIDMSKDLQKPTNLATLHSSFSDRS